MSPNNFDDPTSSMGCDTVCESGQPTDETAAAASHIYMN